MRSSPDGLGVSMYEKGTRFARARHLASLAALAALAVGSGSARQSGQAIPAGFSHVKSLGRHRRVSARQQRPDRIAGAGSFRARGDLRGHLSGRVAQRGDRHDRRHAYPRTHDVQGQRCFQRCEGQQHQADARAGGRSSSMRAPPSIAPIISRPSAAKTWRATSPSRRIACAICGCTSPTGSRK